MRDEFSKKANVFIGTSAYAARIAKEYGLIPFGFLVLNAFIKQMIAEMIASVEHNYPITLVLSNVLGGRSIEKFMQYAIYIIAIYAVSLCNDKQINIHLI